MKRYILMFAVLGFLLAACAGHDPHAPRSDEFGFLEHMIPHHQEAVDSARALQTFVPGEPVAALLADIIAAQEAEIAQMRAWLADWYPDRVPGAEYTPMMRPLTGLTKDDAVTRWLIDMIAHHEMAVQHAHELLEKNPALRSETRQLALDIIASQEAEIALMRSWLGSAAPASTVPAMDHRHH